MIFFRTPHPRHNFSNGPSLTDVSVLTTFCIAVRFRANFQGKAYYVEHFKPVFFSKENGRLLTSKRRMYG